MPGWLSQPPLHILLSTPLQAREHQPESFLNFLLCVFCNIVPSHDILLDFSLTTGFFPLSWRPASYRIGACTKQEYRALFSQVPPRRRELGTGAHTQGHPWGRAGYKELTALRSSTSTSLTEYVTGAGGRGAREENPQEALYQLHLESPLLQRWGLGLGAEEAPQRPAQPSSRGGAS